LRARVTPTPRSSIPINLHLKRFSLLCSAWRPALAGFSAGPPKGGPHAGPLRGFPLDDALGVTSGIQPGGRSI
jgi:hypothetical protein